MRNAILALLVAAIGGTQAGGPAYAQSTLGTIFSNPGGGVYRATKNPPKSSGHIVPRNTAYTPLSKQECEGLGGKVHFSLSCKSSGYVCATVDPHGVVRTQCLTK